MANTNQHCLRTSILVAVAGLLSTATQAPPNEVRCEYVKRHVCSETGCRPFAIGPAFLIVPSLDQIIEDAWPGGDPVEVRRCDDRGCTPVSVLAVESGLFLNLTAPSSGYLLKLATDTDSIAALRKGQFVELATQGLSTYLGFGTCRM